ncbi:MAG TPA: AMP-binding protein [Verrucomicrobiae bacterium]|jgi:long-chain acyl-CoA synthetase
MSIVDGLRISSRLSPDKPAIICGEQSLTYAEFDRLTDNVAARLLAAGVQPGDRVAVHMLNCSEVALTYGGCLKVGAIVVPINSRLKGREIAYILRHSGSVCYVGQCDLYCEVAGLRKELADLRIFFLSGQNVIQEGVLNFENLLKSPSKPVSLPAIVADQSAVIIYTSGTTAHPKGVTHSHETLMRLAETMRSLDLDENQVVITTSSMAHILSFAMVFLAGLVHRSTVVLIPQIDCHSVLQALERHRGTVMAGLPTFFQAVARTQTATPYDVRSGKHFYCGGDSVSPALQEEFQRAMGQSVYEGYGSTEAVPLTFNKAGAARVGSIGRAIEGVRIRLLGTDGRDVAPGEVGEICAQSPWLMTGYWKDPEATEEAIRDGWFHTGDLARCDADGYYWFAGRAKQIIIRGGSNISPQEVESVIGEHPAVREAAVIGRPDSTWGEIVVAYVSIKDGQSLTEKELIEFARARMAAYKTPEHVIFKDALPKNATGKMDRRALREAERAQATL